MPTSSSSSPLPASLLHGYGAAASSLAIANTAVMFFLLWFLVDHAGLTPAQAGTVLLVGKAWDAISDPLIGRLSDRTRSPMGQRRVWIACGSLPFVLLFAALFQELPLTGWPLVAATCGLLIAWSTAYTAVVVPYGALTPLLTDDYDERTRLNGARMGWSMVGGILAGILGPMLGRRFGWGVAAAALGALMVPGLAATLWRTRGLDRTAPLAGPLDSPRLATPRLATPRLATPRVAPRSSIWSVLSCAPFRRTALLFVFAWTSIASLSSLVPFFINHHIARPDLLDPTFAAIQISALLCIPAVTFLARRLDKARAYALFIGSWALVLVGLALVPAGAGRLALLVAGLCGPGVAAAHVLPWSMLPDVIEADRAQTGQERAGAFYGMMTFLEKGATALALWGAGVLLGFAGYVEGAEQQSPRAIDMVRVLIGPVPAAILLLAALLAWLRPPLTRRAFAGLARQGGSDHPPLQGDAAA